MLQADFNSNSQPMQRMGVVHNIRPVEGEAEDMAENATGPTRITCPLQTESIWKCRLG